MNIQTVLAGTGIPTYNGAWRPATGGDPPPAQYITYTYMRMDSDFADDEAIETSIYAYVTLWSRTNPEATAAAIVAAVEAAGWGVEEETSGYEGGTMDKTLSYWNVDWTFVLREEAE